MSRDDVELVRSMLESAQHDIDALLAFMHEDIEFHAGPAQILGESGTFRGPDGVREFFRKWVGAFSDWGYDVGEVCAHDGFVIAEVHQWGTGKVSGARVDQHFWQVWTLHDGRAIRWTNHFTRDEAIGAARR